MLTALRISSIDISTSTPLRRTITPYTPIENRIADSRRNWFSSIGAPSVPSGQDDGPDQGGEQEDGDHLERHEVVTEDRVRHHLGAAVGVGLGRALVGGEGELLAAEGLDERVAEHQQQADADDRAE